MYLLSPHPLGPWLVFEIPRVQLHWSHYVFLAWLDCFGFAVSTFASMPCSYWILDRDTSGDSVEAAVLAVFVLLTINIYKYCYISAISHGNWLLHLSGFVLFLFVLSGCVRFSGSPDMVQFTVSIPHLLMLCVITVGFPLRLCWFNSDWCPVKLCLNMLLCLYPATAMPLSLLVDQLLLFALVVLVAFSWWHVTQGFVEFFTRFNTIFLLVLVHGFNCIFIYTSGILLTSLSLNKV